MAKIKLTEIYEVTAKVLFEGKNKDGEPIMNFLTPIFQADEATSNGRTYPRALMNKQINRVQKDIESGRFLGASSHDAKLDNVSHIVNKAWIDKNGQGWMEAKIIPTTKGKNLMTIVKEGGRIGVSTRGFGNVVDGIVADDYVLKGVDCVLDQAFEGGTFNQDNVFESANFDEEEDPNIEHNISANEIKEEIERVASLESELSEILKIRFSQDKESGKWSGTWEQYLESYEDTAREIFGLEPKDEEKKRLAEIKRTIPRKKVTVADVFAESRLAGIPASVMAEKINKNIDVDAERVKSEKEKLEKRRDILKSAKEAGADTSTQEKRDEIVENWLRSEKTICESMDSDEQETIRLVMEETNCSEEMARDEYRKLKKAEKEKNEQITATYNQNQLAGYKLRGLRAPEDK